MRRIGLLLGLAALPSVASAAAIERAELAVEDDYLALHLKADVPVGDTEIRSEPGSVRVWLYGLPDDRWLDPVVDGRSLAAIRIRPGFGDTMVVHIRVGDRRTLPTSAIRVEKVHDRAIIRIARSALPPIASRFLAPPEEEASEATAQAEEAALRDAEQTVSQPPADAASRGDANATAAPTAASMVDEDIARRPRRDRRSRKTAATPMRSDHSMTWVLLLVTVLLAAVYGGLRLVFLRRKHGVLDDIEIVAQRRLGPRHSIVLVRALGEDHLLSVNGQATQRIASTPSLPAPQGEEDEAINSTALFARSFQAHDAASSSVARQSHSEDVRQPFGRRFIPEPRKEEPKQFGPELLRFALEHEKKPPPTVRPPRGRGAQESEAVAGLIRMRDRLAAN